MTRYELQQLRTFENSRRKFSSFRANIRPSKRSVKANEKGIGQVLKNSRVSCEVPVERIFPKHP